MTTCNPDQHIGSAAAGPPNRVLIVCATHQIALVLGTYQDGTRGSADLITRDNRPAWQHDQSNRALWRFITEHVGDHIETVTEGDTRFVDGSPIPPDLVLIELDTAADDMPPDDITISAYVSDWPGRPRHRDVAGPRRYTTLHPQPEPYTDPRLEQSRATLRPGEPAAPGGHRPLHIPHRARPAWLGHLLHFTTRHGCWTLSAITHSRIVELDHNTHLAEWDTPAAQHWARQLLQAGIGDPDPRRPTVTEWRPVVHGDTTGWVPLFDTTDPALPWTDLTPTTGSRTRIVAGNAVDITATTR